MLALIQRVNRASVTVEDKVIADINHGILALIGIEREDSLQKGEKLLNKILNYRIFSDENDKMNLNITQVNGSLLLVSQFTLAADTHKGNRPGFDPAMPPEPARILFGQLVDYAVSRYSKVATGEFAAYMRVDLENDGPVTFILRS